ncbi:hypothetical protein ACV56Z_01895 [Staphylococcus aureus]
MSYEKIHWISFSYDINFRGMFHDENESSKDTNTETKSVPEEMEKLQNM